MSAGQVMATGRAVQVGRQVQLLALHVDLLVTLVKHHLLCKATARGLSLPLLCKTAFASSQRENSASPRLTAARSSTMSVDRLVATTGTLMKRRKAVLLSGHFGLSASDLALLSCLL